MVPIYWVKSDKALCLWRPSELDKQLRLLHLTCASASSGTADYLTQEDANDNFKH